MILYSFDKRHSIVVCLKIPIRLVDILYTFFNLSNWRTKIFTIGILCFFTSQPNIRWKTKSCRISELPNLRRSWKYLANHLPNILYSSDRKHCIVVCLKNSIRSVDILYTFSNLSNRGPKSLLSTYYTFFYFKTKVKIRLKRAIKCVLRTGRMQFQNICAKRWFENFRWAIL